MSLFYFLIFGMMLADVVYGLLLVVFGLLIYKVLDVGEGVKSLSLMFAYCGISCMLFGFYSAGISEICRSKFCRACWATAQ